MIKKLLLYCTKGKPYLTYDIDINKIYYFIDELYDYQNTLNGKIVGECDFEVSEIKRKNTIGDWYCYENQEDIWEQAKLGVNDFFKYLEGKNGYAIHIKNLHIFDEPKELKDLEPKREIHQCIHGNSIIDEELEIPIKAPQNMMRVKLRKSYYDGIPVSNDDINANEETLEDYILISIHPEWLCKILNGEKTIEIRKKILRDMI